MTKVTIFPTVEEALYLHKQMLEVFGGTGGVRDLGLLESALARPRSGYYASLTEQAAALLHSLVMNHCFVDGNKPVAFALTDVFLRLNGYFLEVEPEPAENFLIESVINAKVELFVITDWIENIMKKLKTKGSS